MRRNCLGLCAVVLGIGAFAACALPAPALAQRVVTWTVDSRYVDVAKAPFNSPPPGVAPRPPALRVDVLLPDGYDGVRRFPVLFLLHGHGDAYDYWLNPQKGDLLHVAPHFPGIVVMPEAATGWYTNWWDGGARGADGRAWESYFLDEIVPLAQQRLRVLPGRSNHAIAGLSMGGEGAIYFAEQLPGYFGSAATFSGVLSIQRPEWPASFDTQGQKHLDVYGDPTAQAFYWAGHDPTGLAGNLSHTRLFVRVGNGTPVPPFPGEATNTFGAIAEAELSQHAADFVAGARRDREDVTYQPTTGVHDWPYWRLALTAALQWGFFGPVADSPSSWTYQTVSQRGRAWDVAFSFSQAPARVETFTRVGATLSATGAGTVTIAADGRAPFTATLPFSLALPALAPSAGRPPSSGGRRHVARCRAGHVQARRGARRACRAPARRHRGRTMRGSARGRRSQP